MSSNSYNLLGLVKTNRLRKTAKENGNILIASESDRDRIINSSSFRRLQQKAQVFPLDENASVRNRLTHSLEVSQVGRFLAHGVIDDLHLSHSGKSYEELAAFVNTVESSCLLHDIGNPPFGHLGEVAIRTWVKKILQKWKYGDEYVGNELKYFDGNPQGLRFSTFLGGVDRYGLNLTASLILSSIKYPYSFKHGQLDTEHKFGIFVHERKAYLSACEKIGWDVGKKFPIATLMEAADDISYCTSDLEDGLEKGIIDEEEMCNVFPEYKRMLISNDVIAPFVRFKTKLIKKAVLEAATCFSNNIDGIFSGDVTSVIAHSGETAETISKIKSIVANNIYIDESVEKLEIVGKSAITGILGHFDSILEMNRYEFVKLINKDIKFIKGNDLEFDYRVFNRLPKSYVKKYCTTCLDANDETEKLARLHLIIDFLAGMTDSFAVYLYQILSGIRMR